MGNIHPMTDDPMTNKEEAKNKDPYKETKESENTTTEEMDEAYEDCSEDKEADNDKGRDEEMNTTYEENETNDDEENPEANGRNSAQEMIKGHFSRRRNKKQKVKETNIKGKENEQHYATEVVNESHDTVENSNVEGNTMTDEELATSTFGKGIQKGAKASIASTVKDPVTTSRKTKENKELQLEDPRREVLVSKKEYISGALLSRIGPGTNSAIYFQDIRQIVMSIFKVDKSALILPHNKSFIRALGCKQFTNLKDMDFVKFFDIVTKPWGHRQENQLRTTMNFYIASDIIEPDLKSLRGGSMEKVLKELSLRMSMHTLLESSDVPIGFFMGKSQKYTWRDNLQHRVTEHLQYALQSTSGAESNETIPLAVKPRTVKSNDITLEVITLYAGKKDADLVTELLAKNPFQEIEIVLYRMKRDHPEEWIQRLQIHNIQVNESRAIKMYNVDLIFRDELAGAVEEDHEAQIRILDLARLRLRSSDDIIYVQCNSADKEWVRNWITQQIPKICKDLDYGEDDTIPYLDKEPIGKNQESKSNKESTQKSSATPAPPSRFQHLLQDPKYSNTKKDAPSTSSKKSGKVPTAIIIGQRPTTNTASGQSYAQATAARNTTASAYKDQSTVSSPDRSTTSTIKTQQEMDLEEELSMVSGILQKTQQQLQETQDELKATQETNAQLQSQLDAAVQEMTAKLQIQEDEMNAKLQSQEEKTSKLEEQWKQLQIQLAQLPNNQENTPGLPRKMHAGY
jgi:hypothetical protein